MKKPEDGDEDVDEAQNENEEEGEHEDEVEDDDEDSSFWRLIRAKVRLGFRMRNSCETINERGSNHNRDKDVDKGKVRNTDKQENKSEDT